MIGRTLPDSSTMMQRWAAKVQLPADPDGCWYWIGAHDGRRYGQIQVKGTRRVIRAYRFGYERFVGPIPEGMNLDHLCRNHACVNPAHLEPVTHRENMRRGVKGILTTHCPHGHEYTPENTYREARRGKRYCLTCKKSGHRRLNDARKVARRAAKAVLT